MRTKTLLLTVALGAAGIASSFAQVYSQNAVGYVTKVFPTGLTLFANPLKAPDNTLGALITSPPLFSNFYKFNGTSFDLATFGPGGWDLPALTLNTGEGGFINTDTAFTNTFVGEVEQGTLVNTVPAGLSIRSSRVPQAAAVDVLGLTLGLFDNLYKWNNGTGQYTIYTFGPAGWDPSVPSVDVAEAVFINANVATTWNRTFSVNP